MKNLNKKDQERINKEKRLIERSSVPVTISLLVEGLQKLGVNKGMTILCHLSMSSLGWVCGGTQCIIQALMKTVSENGNIIMASYTGYNSDPEEWEYPPVPESWISIIKKELPPYDKELSPTGGVGRVSESFRSVNGVKRSNHPRSSFLAWGKHAEHIVSYQGYDYPFGPDGPLGKAYDLNAYILMVGVDYSVINSFYLAYYLAEINSKQTVTCRSVINKDGKREWVQYDDYVRDITIFKDIYRSYIKNNNIGDVKIGNAYCRLIPQRGLVDFAKKRLESRKKD